MQSETVYVFLTGRVAGFVDVTDSLRVVVSPLYDHRAAGAITAPPSSAILPIAD